MRTLAVLAFAAGLLLAGCNKTPLDAAHKDYAGEWVARDGTRIHLWSNGTGDFKGSNTKVEGAAARFVGDRLEIKMLGLGREFRITAPPRQVAGAWVLVLDGEEFVRQEGGGTRF